MKNIMLTLGIFFISSGVNAQIGSSKSYLIEKHPNHKMKVTDNGTDYISYRIDEDGYTTDVSCFLTPKKENKEQLCYRVVMKEPSSETNNWIRYFNKRKFIKLDGMVWKDYERSTVYELSLIHISEPTRPY